VTHAEISQHQNMFCINNLMMFLSCTVIAKTAANVNNDIRISRGKVHTVTD